LAHFVQVAVNVPLASGVFDYHLPPDLVDLVQPGSLVVVPFGQQTVQGIVQRPVAEPQVQQTRPVEAVLDPAPVLTAAQMALASWLAEETLSPLALCLHLMLPPGLSQQADTLYTLMASASIETGDLTDFQQKMVSLLQTRGPLRGRQLATAFPHLDWKKSAAALVRRGVLLARPVLPQPQIRPKTARTVQLICRPEEIEGRLAELGREGTPARQRRLAALRFLAQEGLPVQVAWTYAHSGCTSADLNKLAEAGLVHLGETEIWRDPLENITIVNQQPPQLTPDQQLVWDRLQQAILAAAGGEPQPPCLLHGVTGSGKTEIYLRAVEETIAKNRQAIILVPEIALTPQTVRRFMARFPGRVGLVHSRLSPGERYDTWRRARAGELDVIVGPRSALFSPLPRPGLIVLDECHDGSYDQDDNPPAYHAVPAALTYARLTGSIIILGSATPDVSQRYQARQEGWLELTLPKRVLAHQDHASTTADSAPNSAPNSGVASLPLPPVTIVDMRHELQMGNRSIFSRELTANLERTLEAGQQAILFLNRRGSATYVFCRACGHVMKCPRCELPLTYHLNQSGLLCHTCGYTRQMPATCPQCKSNQIRQYGAGTERVEQEVRGCFPTARTLRLDAESVQQKGAHEIILSHFVHHRADILIGTQMIAKGLDLPLVTFVGAVLADVGLQLPDYRAGERGFQLLSQVVGRAGRSPLGGRAVIQTFNPDHYAIQLAALHDYDGFYDQELAYRRQIHYPPFARLVRLEYRHVNPEQAAVEANNLAARLSGWLQQGEFSATDTIGPLPCFYDRVNGEYRWQIILRGPNPAAVLRGRSLENWRIEVDPASLL